MAPLPSLSTNTTNSSACRARTVSGVTQSRVLRKQIYQRKRIFCSPSISEAGTKQLSNLPEMPRLPERHPDNLPPASHTPALFPRTSGRITPV